MVNAIGTNLETPLFKSLGARSEKCCSLLLKRYAAEIDPCHKSGYGVTAFDECIICGLETTLHELIDRGMAYGRDPNIEVKRRLDRKVRVYMILRRVFIQWSLPEDVLKWMFVRYRI